MALELDQDAIQAAEARERRAKERLRAAGVIAGLALLSVAIDDTLTPFFSLCFVFGIVAAFVFAVNSSAEVSLFTGAGVLGIMLMAHLGGDPENFVLFLWQLPFFIVFFIGLAYLPNLLPRIIQDNVDKMRHDSQTWDAKVAELEAVLQGEQANHIEEMSSKVKQEIARYSSRNALLTQFSRSTMQAGSSREVLNLLFHTLTKTFGVQECVLMIHRAETSEIVVTRALHPEYQTLENTKHDRNASAVLEKLFERRTLIHLTPPDTVVPGIVSELVFPVFVDDEIHGIFGLAKAKERELSDEDVAFIDTLAAIASGAIEQIQIATSTS